MGLGDGGKKPETTIFFTVFMKLRWAVVTVGEVIWIFLNRAHKPDNPTKMDKTKCVEPVMKKTEQSTHKQRCMLRNTRQETGREGIEKV